MVSSFFEVCPLGEALSPVEWPFDVSVVIPVFGGEQTLKPLAESIDKVAAEQDWKLEIILVCDAPHDGSWDVAKGITLSHAHLRAFLLRRNFGQHPATLLGIRKARGRTTITMDEDLQHDPKDMVQLVADSLEHRAIVYGVGKEQRHAWWRNTSSRMSKWFLAKYIGVPVARSISAFRAFPTELRDAFAHYRAEKVVIDVLLSWTGAPYRNFDCQHSPRAGGHSGYTLRKLFAYLTDLLLGFSTAPLRVASIIGLVSVLASVLIGGFVLIRWLIAGSVVPGFTFLALSISVLGGIQLLALGLIGEYLGRMYFNNLGRPQYLVAEVVEYDSRPNTSEETLQHNKPRKTEDRELQSSNSSTIRST